MYKYTPLFKQVILFCIVGVVTLCIDVGTSTFLYVVVHLPAYLASGIGFLSGFFVNFPINRKKVFHHSDSDRFSLRLQVVLYVLLCLFNLIVTSFLVNIMVNSGFLAIEYAKILVTMMIAVWNFLLFKLFIFSKRTNEDTPTLFS